MQKLDADTGSLVSGTPTRVMPELMKQFFGTITHVSKGDVSQNEHDGAWQSESKSQVRKALAEQ